MPAESGRRFFALMGRVGRSRPSGRRQRRRAETEERILRAALLLFAIKGYTQATIDDIVDAADIGRGTFFNYFPSKEHVFAPRVRMSLATMEKVLRRLVSMAAERSHGPGLRKAKCIGYYPRQMAMEAGQAVRIASKGPMVAGFS